MYLINTICMEIILHKIFLGSSNLLRLHDVSIDMPLFACWLILLACLIATIIENSIVERVSSHLVVSEQKIAPKLISFFFLFKRSLLHSWSHHFYHISSRSPRAHRSRSPRRRFWCSHDLGKTIFFFFYFFSPVQAKRRLMMWVWC